METLSKMYYIYEIYNNVTQRRYIGLTKSPQNRFAQHLVLLRNGKHTAENIVKDYVRYGENSFSFRIIDTANDKVEGAKKERDYILKFNSYVPDFGYNGNDNRFCRTRKAPKCADTELARKIKSQGYLLHDMPWKLNMTYYVFISKLNSDNFTKEETEKIKDILSLKASDRKAIEYRNLMHKLSQQNYRVAPNVQTNLSK